MKIGKRFNQLTKNEYFYYIDQHKKYTNFNTLGLYRSIIENERLGVPDQIEIRDYANKTFAKTFDFFQLKDPSLYIDLVTLGREMTKADERQVWQDLNKNQQKILKEKRIKYRSFGVYSKHNCGYEWCPLNGVMIKKGWPAESEMCFGSDKNDYMAKEKSLRIKQDRKSKKRIIQKDLEYGDLDELKLTY